MGVEPCFGEEFDSVLAAAQAGAEWAFAALYRQLNPRLLRYFGAQAGGHAEDLAAETWMGAASQMGRFEGGEEAFRRWLFTIAHHRLVQYWRDARRRPRATATDGDAGFGGDGGRSGNAESEAVGVLSAGEAARRIAALLPPDQAEVVLLRVLGDLSVEQVAQATGRRPGTVRVLQHRALRKLADTNFSDFWLEAVTK